MRSGTRASSVLLSPFLCVTRRDRVSTSVYGLSFVVCFLWFLCRTESGKQNLCYHMIFGCCATSVTFDSMHGVFYMSRFKRWVGGLIAHVCHAVSFLMRHRGSLQHRGHIGYTTPLTFGTRSQFLQFSRFQFLAFGFVTAIAFIWWILSPYFDE